MGQLGEANYVVFVDPSQTLRTFVDMKTIGADRQGAYAAYEVIPESDVKAKSAYIAKEDPLLTYPSFRMEETPNLVANTQSQEMRISLSTRCPATHSVSTGNRIRKVQKFSDNPAHGRRP